MKTTLNIDDGVMRRLKKTAAEQGVTMSELVEAALRRFFEEPKTVKDLPELPSFAGGKLLIDIANRDALYDAMDGDDLDALYQDKDRGR